MKKFNKGNYPLLYSDEKNCNEIVKYLMDLILIK